jgi:hypothetical protein
MANSRDAGSVGSNPWAPSPRTGGALGSKKDAGDPDTAVWFTGDTPGSGGRGDAGDPDGRMSRERLRQGAFEGYYQAYKEGIKDAGVKVLPDAGMSASRGFSVINDKDGGPGDENAVNEALNYLNRDPGFHSVIDAARQMGITIVTKNDLIPEGGQTDHANKTIYWNPHEAQIVPTTRKNDAGSYGTATQSPAMVLGHELAHFTYANLSFLPLEGFVLHQFGNPTDKKIIEDLEQPATKFLPGEAARVGHYSKPIMVPYTTPPQDAGVSGPDAGLLRRDAGTH